MIYSIPSLNSEHLCILILWKRIRSLNVVGVDYLENLEGLGNNGLIYTTHHLPTFPKSDPWKPLPALYFDHKLAFSACTYSNIYEGYIHHLNRSLPILNTMPSRKVIEDLW